MEEREHRVLVWHDEFENENLDMSLWDFQRTMNCTDAVYDNSSKELKDSKLYLITDRCGDTVTLCEGLTTMHTMLFKYGYLEMRAKIPYRHAAWPSFWLLGNTGFHDESINWFSEIDIFEVFSSADTLGPNLHKWGKYGHEMLPGDENNPNRGYRFKNPESLNSEYHIYGFEWTKTNMKFYVDGECYFTVSVDGNSSFVSEKYPTTEGFHEPVYISINNELFTDKLDWYPQGSALSEEDKLPFEYVIDWVRLYQNSEEKLYVGNDIPPRNN